MAVTRDDMYNPEQALQRLREQEQILNALIETQTCLQLLVTNNIVSREDVAEMRNKVRNSNKYKAEIEALETEKATFKTAQDNPQDYLKALLNAKLNGNI